MKRVSLFFAGVCLASSPATSQQLPNIIYIFTDQQTASAMSCAGNADLKTPNLDRLAKEGIRFVNAYCSFPLCSPSRVSMFTGLMPHQVGITKNGLPIPEKYIHQTLGHLLSGNGYECVYAGKWHLPKTTIDPAHGFSKIHNFGDIGLAESCIEYLRQKHQNPFFMVAAFDNPHNICEYARNQPLPWNEISEPPIEECPNLPPNFFPAPFEPDLIRNEQSKNFRVYPIQKYSCDDWRRYRNAYYRLIEHVDKEIGSILDALDQNNLSQNTVIIFSSDHGDGNSSHQWNQKSALFEEVINIPLIICLPGQKNAGDVLQQIVSSGPDIFATICDFAKVKIPVQITGKSLRSLVEGHGKAELHPFIVTETCFDGSDQWGWMVRTQTFKYILYQSGRYREQLFDMENDRKEQVNLAVEKRSEEKLMEFRDILRNWAIKNNEDNALKFIPK